MEINRIKIIAILLTCYNRKLKTLACLKKLYLQDGMDLVFKFDVYLVDDGCTDNTVMEIKIQYPKVKIIASSGNLFWNRGMHLAWQNAVETKDYDYYLWLNDDTFLDKSAINQLLSKKTNDEIICGTTQSTLSGIATYGGYTNSSRAIILPNRLFQSVDYCNGNCVLIPKAVYGIVGNLDPFFHHAVGDFDYSLRAKKLGIKIYIAPEYLGTCESHTNIPKWQSSDVKMLNRFKNLYSPLSGCNPTEFFIFEKRHNGYITAIFHYFTTHLRAIFPRLWGIKAALMKLNSI